MKILRKIIIASAMFGCAYAQNLVSVEAFDEQGSNPSQLTLRLKLTNNTSNTLNDVHAKYFLGFDRNKTLNVSPYYMAGATTSIDTVGDFLVVNINVASLAPGVFPNSSGISLGMNYTDWSTFNKQDNFSYPNASNFVVANNIPVYANGAIVAGLTPINDPVNEEPPKIRFVGIQPENTATRSAWVELQNYDTTAIDLNGLYLKWSASDSVGFGNVTLSAGQKVRVCKSSSLECPAADANLVLGILNFGLTGEFELSKQSKKIDYIAWGAQGTLDPAYSFLKTQMNASYAMQTGYRTGCFFRYIDGTGWNIYSAGEINKDPEALPDGTPFGITDGMSFATGMNNQVRLSWVPVKGANSYIVKIFDGNNNLVYEKTTSKSFDDVVLNSGEYHWNVTSVNNKGFFVVSNEYKTFFVAELHELDGRWTEGYILGVESIAARKDTRMLVPTWGNLAEIKGWNRVHTIDEEMTEEETWRCWAVGVNMLNRYYGGTLTQDEIKMYGFRSTQDPNVSHLYDFMLEGYGGGSDAIDDAAFQYAFGIVPPIHVGAPSYAVVKGAINNQKPLYVSVDNGDGSQHVMVIDGYGVVSSNITAGGVRVFSMGDVLYHFLNIDNNGSAFWIKADVYDYINYRILENPAFVRNKDYRVDNDKDGDGIVDYDEDVRFGKVMNGIDCLNANRHNSDDDGILDYDEFLLNTKRCSPYNASGEIVGCREMVSLFDTDKDGYPNYCDWDSDNGGESDGSEDKAGRNMFIAGDDIPTGEITFDNPSDITIYSLESMRVNDRSVCRDGEGYCKIASESGRIDFAVNVGVQAVVGDIYSRGGVWLRSRSVVSGNIYTYFRNVNASAVNVQGMATFEGREFSYDHDAWPYHVWDNKARFLPDIDLQPVLTVSTGEEKTLSHGDRYSKVKVESGATLKIEPGLISVGNIQFESGSTITFTNPGQQTVLHADGSTIWRTSISNEDKELVARGFKLIQYSDNKVNIEGDWAGTIHAARSSLVMGQAKKIIYGRFLAKSVTMHQNSMIYRVDFDPITSSTNLAMIYRVDFDSVAQSTNLALR